MKKTFSLLIAALMVVVTMINVGCDLGTYQQRANAPIPSNTAKAGEVGSVQPQTNEESTDDGESE